MESTPGFTLDDHSLVPYTEVGIGYAWSDLNHPLYGVAGTALVVLDDSNGYTANVGLGAKYYMTDNFFVDSDQGRPAMTTISTRYADDARGAPTVARAGAQPGATQASQTAFISLNVLMSVR